MSGILVGIQPTALVVVTLTALLVAARARAQAPPGPSAASASAENVPIEVFKGPQPTRLHAPDCARGRNLGIDGRACEELAHSEGWVELSFMVDSRGKPFEVTVIGSTGDPTFEQAAKSAIEHSMFKPGSLNGRPVESGSEIRYVFMNPTFDAVPGAKPEFIDAYNVAMHAIDSGDRARADQFLKKLQVTNLYEDAYLGVASYEYALKWGTASQQLDALRRATSWGKVAQFLSKREFKAAMVSLMSLELKTREYAEALETAESLKKLSLDMRTAAQIESAVAQLGKLRLDNESYEMSGAMPKGSWYLHLFKRHFYALVNQGYISQVKLRCDKRYVFFAFDPKIQYQVANDDGQCTLELDGAPGTQFKLIQF